MARWPACTPQDLLICVRALRWSLIRTPVVLFRKNDHAVLPIASLTKLMTGLVISDARLPMSEMIAITQADVDTEKGSSSRRPWARCSVVVICCIWR